MHIDAIAGRVLGHALVISVGRGRVIDGVHGDEYRVGITQAWYAVITNTVDDGVGTVEVCGWGIADAVAIGNAGCSSTSGAAHDGGGQRIAFGVGVVHLHIDKGVGRVFA